MEVQRFRSVRTIVAALALTLAASAAWAQDYIVTAVSGQYVAAPSTATNILPNITNKDDGIYTITGLPFPIPYFGVSVTSISVCTNGYCFMNASGAHASAYSPPSYPYPQTTAGTSGRDGIVAVAWQDLDGRNANAKILTWVDGTAPNRRFIVSWVNWQHFSQVGSCAFQVQFHESGRIQMAYTSGWTSSASGAAWNYATGVGIDALIPDTRWVTPNGSSTYTFSTSPVTDWRFEPKVTTFTGRVTYDRLVVDASGIGNSVTSNVPLSGLAVELRNATTVLASGTCDAEGAFTLQAAALPSAQSGSVVVTSASAACIVRASSGGSPYAFTLATNVPFSSDRNLGTISIGASNDTAGALRAPLNVARTIQEVYDWSRQRTQDPIVRLEVLYDTASTLPTSYTRKSATAAAQMRVSAASANPDPWDTGVIRRTYARHVLGRIAADATTTYDARFDAVTDQENAFAEGFGYYLDAAISGGSVFVDGLSSSSATRIELEEPTLVAPRGADVAGWVATALYDLVDAANEPWDQVDGTGAADRVFRAVDTLTSPVTTYSFAAAWGPLGYDGAGLSTIFIRHGVLADDADEPNDTAQTSTLIQQFGFLRRERVLNLYNEDWYQFALSQPTDAVTADVVFNRLLYDTEVGVSVLDSAGNEIVAGAPLGPNGPFEAKTGTLTPGSYRLRIRHLSGARLANYSVQVAAKLVVASPDFQPWTVGRRYEVPIELEGGIPPYRLRIPAPFSTPPGLVLQDSEEIRVAGTPSRAGSFDFVLVTQDSANPPQVSSIPVHLVINPELELSFGTFQAFVADRDVDRAFPFSGGTAPFTVTVTEGALPSGLTVVGGNDLRFSGSSIAAGSASVTLVASDVAGSTQTQAITIVACSPFGRVPLDAAKSAAGFYFDAVQGSVVNIRVRTAPNHARRLLSARVLDVDGTTVLDANVHDDRGTAALSRFVAPSTGRFYFVVASDDGGPATELVATGRVTPATRGAGDSGKKAFVAPDREYVEIGALAGSTIEFRATTGRSGLSIRPLYLIDPTGGVVQLSEDEWTTRGGGFVMTKVLPADAGSGTWRVAIVANPGPEGRFRYSWRVKAPRDAVFKAD